MAMELFKLVGSIFIDTDKANESLQKTDKKASSFAETLGNTAKGAVSPGKRPNLFGTIRFSVVEIPAFILSAMPRGTAVCQSFLPVLIRFLLWVEWLCFRISRTVRVKHAPNPLPRITL